jgi:hypothetical protein
MGSRRILLLVRARTVSASGPWDGESWFKEKDLGAGEVRSCVIGYGCHGPRTGQVREVCQATA